MKLAQLIHLTDSLYSEAEETHRSGLKPASGQQNTDAAGIRGERAGGRPDRGGKMREGAEEVLDGCIFLIV